MKSSLRPSIVGTLRASPGQVVHLLAGQVYFGPEASQVRTLLGSCVSITLWHPQRRLGGMCHFLLPERPRTPDMPLDARFGIEAVAYLVEAIRYHGLPTHEFDAYLYGGADTLPDSLGLKFDVGERNIEVGWGLIDHHGFTLQEVDVGDNVPRSVVLDLQKGEVSMRRGQPTKSGSGLGDPR
jgi:chemotaxis protein CheD